MVIIVAKVLCEYEIRPDDPDVKPATMEELIRKSLPDGVQMQNETKDVPIAFGLVAMKAQFIIEERDGLQDELEEYLFGTEGVGNVVLGYTTRL